MDSLYRAKDLHYSYGWNQQTVPVLKNINLEIPVGAFCCFVGPSGTGKTTLLNILGLIDQPNQGQLSLLGENVTQISENDKERLRLEKIGYVFQTFHLIPTLSVLENTTYFLPMLGYGKAAMNKSAMQVLDILGIADHAAKKPLELSGGQRQRVAIARALVKKPAVILADEPTANLDSETATKTILAFQELQRTEKTSFIFSTHDSHLVSYASKVFPMKDGQIASEAKV